MFDTALLESRKDPKSRGKAAGLPLAIGLHVAVIGAFVGASIWSTGEPPEPVTTITFFPTKAGPPPPLGPGGRKEQPVVSHPRSAPLSQPLAVPDQPAARDSGAAEFAHEEDSVLEGDDGAGLPNGVPFGTGATPGGEPGSVPGDEPLPVGGDVKAPVPVSQADPDYPEGARRLHLDGTVILEAIITADGIVDAIRVVHSANPLLDAAAEKAVRQWRYRPATLNGRPVKVFLTVTVTFGLKS